MYTNIEKELNGKIYDLSLNNRGEVRRWNYGKLEKWISLGCGDNFTIKMCRIGRTYYRYMANNEGEAIQKYLDECNKAYGRKLKEASDDVQSNH